MQICPDITVLRNYFFGELEAADFDSVGAHLENCGQCQSQLEQFLESQTFQNAANDQSGDPVPADNLIPTSLEDRIVAKIGGVKRTQALPLDLMEESNEIQTDRQLGDFKIIREIGRGGMGVVYEALQLTLGRRVALKVLPQNSFSNNDAVVRFEREAAAAASLHHTNIVPVYEAGNENGTFYYAMQLIEGEGLNVIRDELRKSRSQGAVSTVAVAKGENRSDVNNDHRQIEAPAETNEIEHSAFRTPHSPLENHSHFVADIGRQAAGALHHAHQRGIIHRDVKPSNLILDVDGIVWLADFGLAKQLDDGLTATQSAPGTLRYMSPERFGGQVDATADVYSLGASLYELLTLKPAFTSTYPMSLMNQIKNAEPPSPKSLDGSVPLDLQTIVMKSMAKEPSQRYATARKMQEDLTRFLDGQPISARSISTVERLSRWAKKRKGLAMALGSLALLIVVTAVGSSIAAFHFRVLAGANLQLAGEKAAETEEATKQRDEAYQNAYFADMRQAHQDLDNGQMRRMLTTLRDYLPTVPAKDVRGWEWYYLLSQAHQDAVTMADFDGTVTQTEWSADGKRIFTRGTDETLRIWKADGSLIRKIAIPGLMQFALNPDSTQIAVTSGAPVLRIFAAESGKLLRTIRVENATLHAVDVSLKGDRFALHCERRGTAYLILLDAKNESVVWESDIGGFVSLKTLQFNSSGTKILLGILGKQTHIFDSGTGNRTAYAGTFEDYGHFQTTCAAWHPDGRRFAAGDYWEGVRVFEIDDSSDAPKELAHFGKGGSADAVAFSPDGKQLIVDNRSQRVDVYELESQELVESFRGHLSALRSVSASPSGELIASSANDGAIELWHCTDPPASQKPAIRKGSGTSPGGQFSWQQQGKQVAVRDRSGEQVAELKGFREFELTSRFFPKVNRCLFYETFQLQGPSSIWIYDTQTWELVHTMKCYPVPFPWGSVAGDFAVVSVHKYVERFSGRTGKVDRIRVHPTNAVNVGLNPDCELMATSFRGEVKLWDTESGKEIANLYGHRPGGWMPRMTWSNTGRYLATGSIDQTIKIWDTQERVELPTLRGRQLNQHGHWLWPNAP